MPFEGILPHLERRYRETESNYVRDDLAQYLSNAACDACDGSRLNEISRNVKILDKTIADVTRMSIGDAESYYQGLIWKVPVVKLRTRFSRKSVNACTSWYQSV